MRNERGGVVGPSDEADLGYVPPRVVSFGWIGEAFGLFGAKALLWTGASALAVFLPAVLFYGLDFAVGDPMQFFAAFTGRTVGTPGAAQYILLLGLGLVVSLISLFFLAGLLRMAVRQVRGVPLRARDVFGGAWVFGPLLGFGLILGLVGTVLALACYAPLILEVVAAYNALFGTAPGPSARTTAWLWAWGILGTVLDLLVSAVLLAVLLPAFAMVVDRVGVLASWRRSVAAMRAVWLPATGLLSVLGLIYFGGSLIPFAVGLLVVLPVLCLAAALAYRDMVGMPGRLFPAPPDYGPPQEGVWPPPPTAGPAPTTWGPSPAAAPPQDPPA